MSRRQQPEVAPSCQYEEMGGHYACLEEPQYRTDKGQYLCTLHAFMWMRIIPPHPEDTGVIANARND